MSTTYPTFADKEAEIGWLVSQLIRSQQSVAFLTQRLDFRADLWEAKMELDQCHGEQSKRLRERVSALEMALAKVLSDPTNKEFLNSAALLMGLDDAMLAIAFRRGEKVANLGAGSVSYEKAVEPTVSKPRGNTQPGTPVASSPAPIQSAELGTNDLKVLEGFRELPKNPNAGVKQAYPNGRWT